ncbi:MAG: hypothetical protein HQK49_20750 [Oligoflexia bacterium]|nr:hypothetical protein [Oligoflexia bacterium]
MHRGLLIVFLLFALLPSTIKSAFSSCSQFSNRNVDAVYGSGDSEAMIILSFNDSYDFNFIYRFNKSSTGKEAIKHICQNNAKFHCYFSHGNSVLHAIGFDQNGDGFNSDNDHFPHNDIYLSGWHDNGYWSYWILNQPLSDNEEGQWKFSSLGFEKRKLKNCDMDAWFWFDNFIERRPSF